MNDCAAGAVPPGFYEARGRLFPAAAASGSGAASSKATEEYTASFFSWWWASIRRTVPDLERMTSDSVVAPVWS